MKLIKPTVEIREQGEGENGMYEHIEWAGRHCYKSHDLKTSDSAYRFVNGLMKSGHLSVLEHGTIYLTLPYHEPLEKFLKNPYTKVVGFSELGKAWYAVTTNLRVIAERKWWDYLKYRTNPTQHHRKRVTVKFVCDRGVSHEFVRHRVFSFSQESQRYCNYNKDKFGGQITFIQPSWWNTASGSKTEFEEALLKAEDTYLKAVKAWDERKPDKRYRTGYKGNPLSPQMARMILPNATKTELVMTGFESDWEQFFELRCASAAHPDARYLADKLKTLMTKNGN